MSSTLQNTRFYGLRIVNRILKLTAPALMGMICLAGLAAPVKPQTGGQQTVDVDVPFEMLAPWYNRDRTEVEDQVMLRGTLHVTTRTWQTRPDTIDRFALHANAIDIHGTSETTGQRFRLTGSFSYDLRNPDVTFNSDGTFSVPMQPFELPMHKVDPEPASSREYLSGTSGATGAAMGGSPPVTIPCERIFAPDGSPTPSINCGSLVFTYFFVPTVTNYRVVVGSGSSCPAGSACVVPDGATLFNGYTGVYNPPLFLLARVFLATALPGQSSFTWHCKTGNREAPVTTIASGGGSYIGTCRPFYSSVDPIVVWGEERFTYWRYSGTFLQQVTLVLNERPFTFRMDPRAVNEAPVVESFSVLGRSRAGTRCAVGELCELIDGDELYNGQVGFFDVPLSLRLTASDPEGDPLTTEWFCKQGDDIYAPITYLSPTEASCSDFFRSRSVSTILIYAKVSDGETEVWTPQRQLYMPSVLF